MGASVGSLPVIAGGKIGCPDVAAIDRDRLLRIESISRPRQQGVSNRVERWWFEGYDNAVRREGMQC